MNDSRLLVLHALTPLHVGTGRGEGLIDLPIARDVVTEHPLIPGSGVKGPLRAACADPELEVQVFGPTTDNASKHAGSVRFSDARLLAMPVPSDYGTFAWVTSPMVLARVQRDIALQGGSPPSLPQVQDGTFEHRKGAAIVSGKTAVLADTALRGMESKSKWFHQLARMCFPADPVWRDLFTDRLAIVSDAFFDARARSGTDVRAHIRIDPDTGTVQDGALWYEESVPAEAIFVGTAHFMGGAAAPETAREAVSEILRSPVTFGGGKTTGMGIMKGHLVAGGAHG